MRSANVVTCLVALPLLLGCAAASASQPTSAGDVATRPAAAGDARPNGRGGGAATRVIPAVPLDRPFRLAFDHLVRVGDTGVRLRFAHLVEDSRCPQGVACFQAGRVRVQIDLMPREGDAQTVELSTDTDRATATAAGLTLELQAVEPAARVEGQRHQPDEYALTLVARRQS